MCGIAGILGPGAADQSLLARMTGTLAHRGPDDSGVWSDPEVGVGVGHRRLAIVDLSSAGHEPMHSASGRLTITFNGEIYNYQEIRAELEARGQIPEGGWRGHSDVEVLLQAIEHWGLERALEASTGMFALALWDRSSRELTLVRDRFGEKPLYYGWAGRDLIFGSELKALRTHPNFAAEIDRQALRLFTERMYVPAPLSIYRGTFKLPPGAMLTLSADAAASPRTDPPREGAAENGLKLSRYWSYEKVVADGLAEPIRDEAEALQELEAALGTAIAGQSMADVPVGAFLSGGIDSSTVVAAYQKHSSQPVRTFTIGFAEQAYNEAPFARAVADALGTVHHEEIVSAADARDTIPLLPQIYDEPFADSSQIPTFLVSRIARKHVKVAITGDGGDELFAGYTRHFLAPRLWRQISRVPASVRSVLGEPLSRLPAGVWRTASGLIPGHHQPTLAAKIRKGLRVSAGARSLDDVYSSFLNEWSEDQSPVIGGQSGMPWPAADFDADDSVRMTYWDAVSYLPDDILCKVDRASMAVSLETRVPFLDHRVAAVAARIPASMKVGAGAGKQILRKLLAKSIPAELIDRPKAGFGIPLGEWLRGPLRSWSSDLLSESRLAREGWFDPAVIQERWKEHLDGSSDSASAIWAILMFQAWVDADRTQSAAAA